MNVEDIGATIRRAGADDWPAIRGVVSAAGLPLDGLSDSYAVFLADHAGRIVGTAAVERHGDGADFAYLLRSVAVDNGFRHAGIGARLVERALREVGPGALVALLTETAADYFPRFGFVPIDRAELPPSLLASRELRGACPDSARILLRQGDEVGDGFSAERPTRSTAFDSA